MYRGIIKVKYSIKSYYLHLFIAFITIQAIPHLSTAQKLHPTAERIHTAYEKLQQLPHAPILQMEYLNTFPYNTDSFMSAFNPHTEDQLTDVSVEYLKRYRELGYDYPDTSLKRAMYIGSNMRTWSRGAVEELQKTIYYLTDKNRDLFTDILDSMKKNEQEGLAKFLYAGENGTNVNYGFITDVVRLHGTKKLYKMFVKVPEEVNKPNEESLKTKE